MFREKEICDAIRIAYNKPEELFDVVNQALHPSVTADNAAG